jgi:hypothetical protein
MFKPKKYEFTITEDDESVTFCMQRRSLDETLEFSEQAGKNKEKDARQMQRKLFSAFLVQPDGTPLSKETIEEMMQGDSVVMSRVSDFIMEKLNLKKAEEKNA